MSLATLDYGRIPPQCTELEEAVLGALILEKNSIFKIIDLLGPDDFYKETHKKIYESIINLYQKNKSIDILTVTEELKKLKYLDEIGGPFYVTQLSSRVASASHIEEHSYYILTNSIKRQIISNSNNISNMSFDDSSDLEDLVSLYNSNVADVNKILAKNKSVTHISQSIKKSLDEIKIREKKSKDNILHGIKTPLKKLDITLNGWEPYLIILAARPSMGKTSFAIHSALIAALNNYSVYMFSLETKDIKISDKFILIQAGINPLKYTSGLLNKKEWDDIEFTAKKLSKLPIIIDDNQYVTLDYIKAKSRIYRQEGKCDLIIIDYLQLIRLGKRKRYQNRDEEVGEITRELQSLRKELNIPIILLCQLNRDVDKRSGIKRPQLSDLRESGNIEQDTDLVIFLNRPERYGIPEYEDGISTRGLGEIDIAKNRNGAIKRIRFNYNPALTKITDEEEEKQKKINYKEKQTKITLKDVDLGEDDIPY